jgi:hypothetical protein
VAETSYLWTTNGTGDGDAGGYTQADTSLMMQIIAACCAHEGVAPGFWDELECTGGGANTVNVATGGALVDGKPYPNNAPVAVNVPSAVGAGNTRIDRIVLRANWAAQTVRITRLAGVDAASPVAPTITQTSGTTYDIMLCRVLVDTSGAVTVTDERVMAWVGTSGIAADAVDGSKIADEAVDSEHIAAGAIDLAHMSANSVDSDQYVDGSIETPHLANDAVAYAKVGAGALKAATRRGGDATDWAVGGGSAHAVSSLHMGLEFGITAAQEVTAGGATVITVAPPSVHTNGYIPLVTLIAGAAPTGSLAYAVYGVADNGFYVHVRNEGAAPQTVQVAWSIIFPE